MKSCIKNVEKLCHRGPYTVWYRAKQSRYVLAIIVLAITIKLSLFLFAAVNAPQGKFLPDSHGYLRLSDMLAAKGAFAIQNGNRALSYETFRTPGYPLFLAIFNGALNIPLDGVVFIQIAMTLSAACITYKAAYQIDPKIALLSMIIILFDPPITIFSLTILTESLFLLLICLFMLSFILYLKRKKTSFILLSALMLAAATYVRPVSYYFGFAVFFFILYANRGKDFWKRLKHAFIFLVVLYFTIGAWQARNYARCHDFTFSNVGRDNLCAKGLFKSYIRNTDPYTKKMAPLPYYANVSTRCLMSLMTRPGNLKYFKSDILTVTGKVLAYPWMVFWMIGFIWGIIRMKRNTYLQLMLFVIIYFISVSIGALMWDVCERLRVPMMPFIAIISAYGWINLLSYRSKRNAA